MTSSFSPHFHEKCRLTVRTPAVAVLQTATTFFNAILGLRPSRLLKNAVHFGYKLRGVRKERARQTGRVLDRDPSAAQIERRPILPAGERSSGHNWFWGRSAPAVPASL